MNGVNKVILIGNLGKDPEIRYTTGGQAVANFSIATTEGRKNKDGERQEYTEWHRIVAWGRLAEICGEYLSKGKMVFVEGSIRTRSWEDKEGNKRYTTEILADNMTMLGGRRDGDYSDSPATAKTSKADVAEPESQEDDLPF